MTPEWGCDHELDALVQLRCLRDEARDVLAHVAPLREHERMGDNARGALLDASRKRIGDGGFGELHVRPLDDSVLSKACFHARCDLADQRVCFGAPASMVDQKIRIHRSRFWDSRGRLSRTAVAQRSFNRPDIRASEQVDVDE